MKQTRQSARLIFKAAVAAVLSPKSADLVCFDGNGRIH
jgi:hypothetical protein